MATTLQSDGVEEFTTEADARQAFDENKGPLSIILDCRTGKYYVESGYAPLMRPFEKLIAEKPG